MLHIIFTTSNPINIKICVLPESSLMRSIYDQISLFIFTWKERFCWGI